MKRPYVLFVPSVLLLLALITWPSSAIAGEAQLEWSPPATYVDGTPFNAATDVSGYTVYYGSSSGTYPNKVPVGNVKTYTIPSLGSGTYYFAVTVTAKNGIESGYSNEASKIIDERKPGGCSLTVK